MRRQVRAPKLSQIGTRTQTAQANSVWKPKTRAILSLVRLNFLSVNSRLAELAEQHEARLLTRDEAVSGEVLAQIERENESLAHVT